MAVQLRLDHAWPAAVEQRRGLQRASANCSKNCRARNARLRCLIVLIALGALCAAGAIDNSMSTPGPAVCMGIFLAGLAVLGAVYIGMFYVLKKA